MALTAGAKLMLARLVTQEARADLFADPGAIVCSSAVPGGELTSEKVPGGVRFSGRWRTASGCEDASWTTVAVPVHDGDQVTRMAALIPAKSLAVDRTWDVAGMSGTGSHTLVADEAFVAETHLLPMALADGRSRIPMLVTLGSMFITLGALLGAGLAARDLVQQVLAEGKAASGISYQHSVDSPLAKYWFSEASHLMDTAVQRCRLATVVLDTAGLDASLPVQERSRLRMELVTAAQECRQGMEKLLDLHGASGFARSNPLQRLWRDVAVGTRHPQFNPWITAEDYGRVLFGVETSVMRGL
jgi:alkylation response protein AidB-like acyl-CoA dehydrogenase